MTPPTTPKKGLSAGRRGEKVWFNGNIQDEKDVRVSLFTHGLHYGTGAFEGIRAYKQKSGGGAVFRLAEHVERFFDSAKILGLKIPFTQVQIADACREACRANQFEECYIRPILYIGDGPLGVNPGAEPPVDVAILTWEWGKYLGEGALMGTRLKISSFIRPHVNATMTKGKLTGNYINSVLAKREVTSLGFDEALLLDAEGYLTEGSGENLFAIKRGVIKTTPMNSILAGITRRTVIEYFAARGVQVVESRMTRDELWCADEVFLCGTAAEITPVREVDSKPIGPESRSGSPGPITLELVEDFAKIVRGETGARLPNQSRNWLTQI